MKPQRIWDLLEHVGRASYLILVVISAFAIAVLAFAVHKETNDRIDDVNKSRYEVTYQNCIDQNERHDSTLRRLDELIAKQIAKIYVQAQEGRISDKDASAQIAQRKASREPTVFLLEAVIPYQNCRAVVAVRYGLDALTVLDKALRKPKDERVNHN